MDLDVAWEDEHLLVVDKPAGVVVHPGRGTQRGTLVHGLLAHDAAGGDDDRPGIVHRLDRDTSGLLVVARSDEAHERLQEPDPQPRGRAALSRARERVAALALRADRGADRPRPARQDAPLARHGDAARRGHALRGRWSCSARAALLDVRLETGRTHQIRVHLEAIELPVSGDPVYGVSGDLGLERQFLHAARLAFDHPFTGERVDVESPLPDDLAAALERARAEA